MTNVCPNCGNNTFIVHQEGIRKAVMTGDRKLVDVEGFAPTSQDKTITCTECDKETAFENLVDEFYFHNFIATGESNE